MFPIAHIHFVFTNVIGFCVIYANMTKTRIFSFIQWKHIFGWLCFNWMQFSSPFYCFNVISNWSIYISNPNMPEKPLYGKFKEECKYDIKIQSKIIIVINVHCLKLYIQWKLNWMYLRTSLDRLVSWLRAVMHHWKTSLASTSDFAEGFIWYLWSDHFMHAPASLCSPFPWRVSKYFQ